MGGCQSLPSNVSEADMVLHREAEKSLKTAKARLETQKKILLLGSGDSGKSTVLKQMRLIHKVPFSAEEMEHYRQLVFQNITHGIIALLEAMEELELKVSAENAEHRELFSEHPDVKGGEPFPTEYLKPLECLWKDESVQTTWARANEFALPENLRYFFTSLDRVFEPTYQPTEEDIVNTRARTIGIAETMFQVTTGDELLIVDVGGQRSERRKWIHCFQDVTAILFLVNLSGYDQCIVEDRDANQMTDALTIWDSISCSAWFKKTTFILFLNKNDLFERKVQHSKIGDYFPDFQGPEDAEAGRSYFLERFNSLHKSSKVKDRAYYAHFTTATNTTMLRVVVAAVEESILRSNLEKSGLIG